MKYLRICESEQIRQQALAQIDYGVLSSAEGVIRINKASGSGPTPQGNDHYVGTIYSTDGGAVHLLCEDSGRTYMDVINVVVNGVQQDSTQPYLSEGQSTIEIWEDPEGSYYATPYKTFSNCPYRTMIIPDYVTVIGESMFDSCGYLNYVTIPNSVTSIQSGAFANCSNLISISIPASVTYIGINAFCDCSNLTSIVCNPIIPPTVDDSFVDTNCPILVPYESVDAYKAAWPGYANRIAPITQPDD